MPVPEPVVIKHSVPCKALKVFETYIMIGLESGEILVYDKKNINLMSS